MAHDGGEYFARLVHAAAGAAARRAVVLYGEDDGVVLRHFLVACLYADVAVFVEGDVSAQVLRGLSVKHLLQLVVLADVAQHAAFDQRLQVGGQNFARGKEVGHQYPRSCSSVKTAAGAAVCAVP